MKYKIGDKVVPVSKTPLGPLSKSGVWLMAKKLGQSYLYVVNYNEKNKEYTLDYEYTGYRSGDFFIESDIVPYGPAYLEVFYKDVILEDV